MQVIKKPFKVDYGDGICSTEWRFVIADDDGNVVDDAQGYGYKTGPNAHRAMWYKFNGGRRKIGSKLWREKSEQKDLKQQYEQGNKFVDVDQNGKYHILEIED